MMMTDYDDDDYNDNLPWLANAQVGENGSDEREAQTPEVGHSILS